MSTRFETVGAPRVDVWIEKPGAYTGLDKIEGHALLLDTSETILVVEGTPAELRAFGQKVANAMKVLPS